MVTKIQVNLDNVITSKDQVKPGMHLWQVGQGGVTDVCEPRYMGQVIGFGSADYEFTDGHQQATHFIINDPHPEVDFVVMATNLRRSETTNLANYVIPDEGFPQHKSFPLKGLLQNPCSLEDVYVTTESYLPKSYNNWYMCDSIEKAWAVHKEMLANWSEHHEHERQEYEAVCNTFDRVADAVFTTITMTPTRIDNATSTIHYI